MPYPESCPECGGAFRNTGTHFTARRNEIGRHVLLELGCQNTTRRFWWDFTTGNLTEDGRPSPIRRAMSAAAVAAASNGFHRPEANGHITEIDSNLIESSGHATLSALDMLTPTAVADPVSISDDSQMSIAMTEPTGEADHDNGLVASGTEVEDLGLAQEEMLITEAVEFPGPPPVAAAVLKDAFVRQLQLDRLTLRQMRSWLMADEARRAIEVAAGATEATYERLALILFGVDLPQLLGKQAAVPPSTGMSAEERLELQREKARIRARLRRAATKAARQQS
jgi:hypothetical protein